MQFHKNQEVKLHPLVSPCPQSLVPCYKAWNFWIQPSYVRSQYNEQVFGAEL